MVKIGKKMFFSEDDIETRRRTLQRAINLLSDPEKFETFDKELNEFITQFEEVHGTNEKVKYTAV
jgi:deoxyhypusine synthase